MIHRIVLAIAILATVPSWNARAETEAERKACANDAQNHCPDEMPDRERVYACLIAKVNMISPACRKIINESLATRRKR